jgi:hypothetical protein
MPRSEPQFYLCHIFKYDGKYCKKSSLRGRAKLAELHIFAVDGLQDSFWLFAIWVLCTKKEVERIFN